MKGFSYNPPPDGLKRGPKPDPTLEKVTKTWTINVTEAEWKALEAMRKSVPCPPTRSAFGRYVLNRFIETHRVRHAPGMVVRFAAEEGA